MTSKYKIISDILGDSYQVSGERLFHCPYCKHHKRKLSINIDKNVYKCWICDTNGRNLRRIVRRFGTFKHLQEWDTISGRIDINDFDNLFREEEKSTEIEQIIKLPEDFISLANNDLPKSSRWPLRYLKHRGVTKKDVLKWKIGYCDSGPYAGRIIIPSFNMDGHVNYYIARTYDNSWPRYKNPPASRNVAFNELYIDWNKDLVIVEGVFDAIIAGNSVPILGSTLRPSSQLVRKIIYNDTPVYLALDQDAQQKENKIIKTLLQYDIELYKIDVSGYEDVGEMSKEEFSKRKENAYFISQEDYLLTAAINTI